MPASVGRPTAPGVPAASRASQASFESLGDWKPNAGSKPADAWNGFTFESAKWPRPAGRMEPQVYQAVEALPGVRGTTAAGGLLNVQLDDSIPKDKRVTDLMTSVLEETSRSPMTNVVFSGANEVMSGTFDPAKSWYAQVGENAKVVYASVMLGDTVGKLKGVADLDWSAGQKAADGTRVPARLVVTLKPNAPAGTKERVAELVSTQFPFAELAFATKQAAPTAPAAPRGWTPR